MIRVTGLHERDDVHIARLPDGLALDQNTEHIAALHALLDRLRPIVVGLDPYYKLYEELDPNEERGVVKLMRLLDRLRVEFDFGLILPAHPRKDQPGRTGIRKLTIHDVAGSGALTRGAEVVLAIERGSPGYARLRVLKDRDGDLDVGQASGLIFSPEDGFRLDPREQLDQEDLDRRAVDLGADGTWRTDREFADKLEIGRARARAMLDRLTDAGEMEYAQGPEARRWNANCWRSAGSGGSDHQKPPDQQTIPGAPLRSAGSTGSGGDRDHLTSRTADDAPAEGDPAGFASSHQKPPDSVTREVCIQTNCGAPRVPGAFYCTAHGAAAPAEAEIERLAELSGQAQEDV
jgi:hypothetical protein